MEREPPSLRTPFWVSLVVVAVAMALGWIVATSRGGLPPPPRAIAAPHR